MYLFKVSILSLSVIVLLCFVTLQTVWYFLVFNLLNKPWSCWCFFFLETLCNEHILNFPFFLNFVQILFHIPRCFSTVTFSSKTINYLLYRRINAFFKSYYQERLFKGL